MSSTSAAAAAWRDPVLVVFAGRPGTGKSTTARLLASRLQAAYVRTDVIAGAVLSGGLTQDPGEAGSVAYVVARGVALENLSAGVPVVIDGVQATHDRRAVWRQLAQDVGVRLVQIEVRLSDPVEHRRRIENRQAEGYPGPTWAEVAVFDYEEWNDLLDGDRLVVDTVAAEPALTRCLDYVTAMRQSPAEVGGDTGHRSPLS
ncbi:MAG: AAA family ATPase [Nocardioidaceae bacterium]